MGYAKKALHRLCHTPATWTQNSQRTWIQPHYGAQDQRTPHPNNTDKLDSAAITTVQEIIGIFLFYGRAIDCTMMAVLRTIASQQSNSIQATSKAITQLINYAAAQLDATIRYITRDM
jgi:hypothetical protein